MPAFQVETHPCKPLMANCYFLIHPDTRETVIVDPGGGAPQLVEALKDLRPVAVLLTHAHFDHFGAVDALCGRFGLPLYVHEEDIPFLQDPVGNVSEPFGIAMTVNTPAIPIHDGELLHLAGLDIRVIHTPGHTPGGVCYRLPENGGIVSGDTLMAHGYGRTDFAGGDLTKLMASLRLLFHLTPRMPLYPGHDEIGTVGRNEEVSPCKP